MKKFSMLIILFCLLLGNLAITAQEKGLGLGIMLGKPTALSGKYWLTKKTAVDFGLGYSLLDDAGFTLHSDFLYHQSGLFETREKLVVHYGFGARIRIEEDEDTSLGARGVIGITWISKKMPLDAFFELAPVFKLIPKTALGFDIAIGARYYLNTNF